MLTRTKILADVGLKGQICSSAVDDMPSHTEHSFTSSAGCHHAKRIFHKITESREFQSGLATTEECRYTLIQQALCSVEFLMVWYRAVESESWSRSREDFQPEESESEGFST